MPRLITLLIALLFGGLFSQAPEFQQQYRQRLGGALEEVNREVDRFAFDAKANAVTVEGALDRLRGNSDAIARARGAAMIDTIARKDRLDRQRQAFEHSSVIGRLASLAIDLDPTLASGTWSAFRPAVPATMDGLAAGLFGAGIGIFAQALLFMAYRFGRRRASAAASAGGRLAGRGQSAGTITRVK